MSTLPNDKASEGTRSASALRIAGMTRFTTIDFPGRLAAVLYCRGCSLRCPYCHNADMQDTRPCPDDLSWESVAALLDSRRGKLEGVVFSGGEPLLQSALESAVRAVQAMGLQTALHTAGMVPERLARVLPLMDWTGYDVKALFEHYKSVTGVPGSGEKARKGLDILMRSGVPYEIRTTADPDLIAPDHLLALARMLKDRGVTTYRLQESSLRTRDYPPALEQEIAGLFSDFEIRRSPLPAAQPACTEAQAERKAKAA